MAQGKIEDPNHPQQLEHCECVYERCACWRTCIEQYKRMADKSRWVCNHPYPGANFAYFNDYGMTNHIDHPKEEMKLWFRHPWQRMKINIQRQSS